jgi:quercetin dioxygenase-like cupin family protein
MIKAGFAPFALAATLGSAAIAQPSTVHKTTLQSQAFPEPVYNTVTVRTLVDRDGMVLRHTHPGVEMAYIVSGDALVKIMGRPDQTLKGGDSFTVPPETPHSVQNVGPEELTVVSTYVVDRSKPIATPAPLPTP